VGGLALLAGLVLLGQQSATTTISALVANPPGGTITTVALVLVLVGAFAKSAQFPFHFWLPGAMAAPTPVSAYLHSATMVKAGIVLVARLAPAFATVGPWRPLVVAVGGLSLLLGGWRALREHDAKLALAHGTVSQLGLLVILVGIGDAKLTFAGTAMILAHALCKAALFLVVGIVDHQTNTRDLRRLAGLGRLLPGLAAVTALAALSMAAVIPTFGFVAKEAGLQGLLDLRVGAVGAVALVAVALGSVLTVAYSVRLVDGLFVRGVPRPDDGAVRTVGAPIDPGRVHCPARGFVAPPALLALLSVVFGLAAARVGEVIAAVAASLDPASGTKHLVLWPGWGPALAISVGTWVVGAGVAEVIHRRAHGRDPRPVTATRVYASLYDGLLVGSRRVTAVVQSGSLPVYLGIILLTLLAGLAYSVWEGVPRPDAPFADSPLQVVLAVATGALALGVLRARRRFNGALLVGGSGYGLALVFLAHGAPDLAVTQFLVETLVIVMFLLVLQHLPDQFRPPPSWAPKALRIGLSVAVGVMVTVFALAVSSARDGRSTGRAYIERSLDEAGGKNVVNVTLVDFRGFDTLGEITVLAVAAIGVVNLVGVARREQRRKHLTDGTDRADPDGTRADDRAHRLGFRSIVLSTTARGLAPVLAVLAVFVAARGHNAPGGGFAGGLILSAALILGYLAEGRRAFDPRRVRPLVLVGVGLALAVAVAVTPLCFGDALLESAIVTLDLPLVGAVKLVSSSLFDVGVMILVAGVVLSALGAFVQADDRRPTVAAEEVDR
jgi:multicomponent Na+:H+ antiporter subunit A